MEGTNQPIAMPPLVAGPSTTTINASNDPDMAVAVADPASNTGQETEEEIVEADLESMLNEEHPLQPNGAGVEVAVGIGVNVNVNVNGSTTGVGPTNLGIGAIGANMNVGLGSTTDAEDAGVGIVHPGPSTTTTEAPATAVTGAKRRRIAIDVEANSIPTTTNNMPTIYPPPYQVPLTNKIPSEKVSDARRKMNQLLLNQQKAQESLRRAELDYTKAIEGVKVAKQNIVITDAVVKNGTEELTDALLQEPTHWNNMYRKMLEFKEANGHVDVKRNPLRAEKVKNPDVIKLGSWVGRVRLEARRPPGHPEHIEPYKVVALDRLGFNWDPRENYWMEKFQELKEYMAKHGKGKMPTRKESLGVWCDGQVLEYNKFKAGIKPCYITQERVDMLSNIGFVWDRMGSAWKEAYEEMKKYRNLNGHCHVPVNYPDKTLFRWIAKQRKKYKNYKEGTKPSLTEEQVKLLAEIDFFEPSELRLAKFHAQKGREKKLKEESIHANSEKSEGA